MSDDDKIISLEPNSVYRVDFSTHLPDSSACACEHCQAHERLMALASVFDEVGDWSAAACCEQWAARAMQLNPMGQRMTAAVIRGEYVDGS